MKTLSKIHITFIRYIVISQQKEKKRKKARINKENRIYEFVLEKNVKKDKKGHFKFNY